MTMNKDPKIPQDAASRSFAQLGLLVGSQVYWEEERNDPQPQRLANLMWWALNPLNLPPVLIGEEFYFPQLGVSAQGLALICSTILQAKETPLSEALEKTKNVVTEVLNLLRIPPTSTLGNNTDDPRRNYQHFAPHIADIAKYVERLSIELKETARPRPHISATTRRMDIWLDPQDINWWVTAIRETLKDYLLLIREKELKVPDVERLGGRLECSVFAPLDISQPLPIPGLTAVDGIPLDKEMQELTAQAKEVTRVYSARREPRYLYLSWDLLAFDFWQDYRSDPHLVQRTMLALWTAWPNNRAWAPTSPEGFSSPSFSLEEATHILTALLPALRPYFFAIKDVHHLPSPKLTFASRTLYPPTFYFADPTPRLPTADKYTENEDVRHLISNCIGYDDPYAETLSWSTLEGSIAIVRGETTQMSHHKAYYLLLPIAARPAQDKEIGSDLDRIVDFLTYQEYTIGLTAADIYKQAKDIESKRTVDSETINTVDFITRKLARLVPTLPKEALNSESEEFVELQLLLGRVQYALEKMRDEANQIKQWCERLVNFHMEYQRENMIMAPVSNLLCLSAALKDNYPYRILQRLVNYLSEYTAQLANISERLGTLLALLSTAISNDALKERERQDRRIQKVVAIIAAVALLVALPTFFPDVNAQAIFKFFGHGTMYTSNTGIFALAMLALAFLLFLLWLRVRILRRMTAHSKPRQEDGRFREYVGQFWDRADYTTYIYETEKRHKEGKLALLPFLLELCARSWRHFRVREPEQEDGCFREYVGQFWELADYAAYMYETEKRDKDCPPPSPALHPSPPNWFMEHWKNGGADSIDSRATWILEGLWLYLESNTNKQFPWADNKQHASEDTIAQVRMLRRLIHVFVLRPDLIPLPRALCILRYKSLQFLDKWTVADNEFLESLTCAGFTPNQVERLQKWLNNPVNQKWIRNNRVDKVAEALRNACITVPFPKGVMNGWQDDLARYSTGQEDELTVAGTKE